MAPRPTVIGTQGYRRGLASLSVVKERVLRVHRNAPVSCLQPPLSNRAPRGRQINWLGTCLVGLIRSCCAISPSSSVSPARWDFASCLSCLATCFGNPLRNFFSPATRHKSLPQIKNPASSAGYSQSNRDHDLDFFLACVRKEPHLELLLRRSIRL
jgi:hypothetical protein